MRTLLAGAALGLALGIEQHEIRLRIDGPQHARVGLIQELLAVVAIAFHKFLYSVDVIECHTHDFGHNGVQAVLCEKLSHVLDCLRRCHRVAQP